MPVGCQLEIEGISTAVQVEGVDGPISVESISGDIEIQGRLEELEIYIVSGEITIVNNGKLKRGDFESVSGEIDFESALSRNARVSFESVSGDITLRLPANVSAEFSINTFSGDIENDFGPEPEKESRFLPAMSLEFSTGSRGAQIDAESFSGRVRLVKQ